jgi:hypothetical protein
MRNTITAPFRRVMRAQQQTTIHEVHFHADTQGRAFVCDHHRCESPRLDTHELGQRA